MSFSALQPFSQFNNLCTHIVNVNSYPWIFTQDWLNIYQPRCLLFSCLLYAKVNSLMNDFEVEGSRSLYKCKYCCFIIPVAFLFICLYTFLYWLLVIYFCLLVYHVNKFSAFVFVAFVYNFNVKRCKSTISFPIS